MPQKIRIVVGVRNLDGEEIAQQHRDENVGGDNADEKGGDQFDAVDEAVHQIAVARRHGVFSHGSSQGSNAPDAW